MEPLLDLIEAKIAGGRQIHLILDYDGTLAEFTATPEDVTPDPELVDLVQRLARHPRLCVTVISGRPLNQVRALLPVRGALLAGTYGIEQLTPQGERVEQVEMAAVRPALKLLKTEWQAALAGRRGFFLEDKGWSLALHAHLAPDDEASAVLASARHAAASLFPVDRPNGLYRQHGGTRFYEVCPAAARKGQSVERLLGQDRCPEALPVYLGDDYNDEDAFGPVHARGGLAILVAAEPRPTQADFRLADPTTVRQWLAELLRSLAE